MHKVIATFFLVLITFVGCSSPPSFENVNADQLLELVNSGTQYVLLDVREPEELKDFGALEGNINIPLGQLETRISELPTDLPIVVVCKSGGRANRAAAILYEHGYTNIKTGGLQDFKDKGYELIYPGVD